MSGWQSAAAQAVESGLPCLSVVHSDMSRQPLSETFPAERRSSEALMSTCPALCRLRL